ncbi:MAG: polysaccharide pyruvyl transferase family protein [Clostridiaceae bacterium]|nr:polysaccharide pyruvyl transferase family protein [Clostridiaceae bacterium]
MMRKRAAILTFHCVPNYGAVLQAYALQCKLLEYFETVDIIDYRPYRVTDEYKLINSYSVFSFITSLISASSFKNKLHKFSKFEKDHFTLVQPDPNVEYDVLFLGSDQIWNPDITRGFDKAYFGILDNLNAKKIVSYAASIGKSHFTDSEASEFEVLISNVDYISLRESDAQKIVNSITERESLVVVDPTILSGEKYLASFVKPIDRNKYILMYKLSKSEDTLALADKVARYLGLELVEISGRRKPIILNKHETIYEAGPKEFLSLIGNADYIVTDSFHGTVLSCIFHKPFLVTVNKFRGSRILNFLEAVQLNERATNRFDRQLLTKEIDWNNVDMLIKELRNKSEEYIRGIIDD